MRTILKFIGRHQILMWILNLTWGILGTIFGLLVSIIFLLTGHKPHRANYNWYFVSRIKGGWGFECGCCFILSKDCENSTSVMCHEYGHLIQNALYGPFIIFLCIGSICRYWYRELKYYNNHTFPPTEYDRWWFEGQATQVGYEIYKYNK